LRLYASSRTNFPVVITVNLSIANLPSGCATYAQQLAQEAAEMKAVGLETALEVAAVPRHSLKDAIYRGDFHAAPPTSQGVPRLFDRDDILALSVQAQCVSLGASANVSWRIAAELRRTLLDGGDELETVWITCSQSGHPHAVVMTQPKEVSFTVPVLELRVKIMRLVEARMARGARN
jgi:hypothetical protein